MTELIHKVADLIDERDREDLEATLASVTFQLAGAVSLTLWRVFRRNDGVWLRKRVVLPERRAETELHEDDIQLAEAREPLRLAYASGDAISWREKPEHPLVCILPVQTGIGALGLIEIELDSDLSNDRMSLLTGMLRIYRSHLAALDYGDNDELTGLANRRTFDDQFARFVQQEARRNGAKRQDDTWTSQAHLAVVDIDFFKSINDRFGHPYGDEVLVLLSGLMRDTFRDSDRLFRFGGEEFVIMVSNCMLEEALGAFERFRERVQAHRFPQIVDGVTVSIGVTSLALHDAGSAAFGRADQALYVAKRTGRNKVLLYEALQQASEDKRKKAEEIELF